MFGQNREKKRFSWRWAVLLVALVAGSLLLVACGDSDPSPTATTEPTSVQATPDEDGDAMMDEDGDAMMDEDGDAMMSLSDIDETTTGAELIASLSEGEADCLRATIGDASYEAMQDLTLSESAMGFDTFPAAMPGAGQRHRPERSHDVAPGRAGCPMIAGPASRTFSQTSGCRARG